MELMCFTALPWYTTILKHLQKNPAISASTGAAGFSPPLGTRCRAGGLVEFAGTDAAPAPPGFWELLVRHAQLNLLMQLESSAEHALNSSSHWSPYE